MPELSRNYRPIQKFLVSIDSSLSVSCFKHFKMFHQTEIYDLYRISMNILKIGETNAFDVLRGAYFFETQRLEIQTSMTCKLLLGSF